MLKSIRYTFNSLFEIPKPHVISYAEYLQLSILFLRFGGSCSSSDRVRRYRLSILFLRFSSRSCPGRRIAAGIFQFSFWDSSKSRKITRRGWKSRTFNSLFEIQGARGSWEKAWGGQPFNSLFEILWFALFARLFPQRFHFQFSFWDSLAFRPPPPQLLQV